MTVQELHLTIRLNGEPYEIAAPLTISDLLARLDIDPRRVAVELNLLVIKRDRYEATVIDNGDEIEVVNLVGGG
jgi:sulfur carrier protein